MTATGRRTAIVTMTGLLVAFLLVWSAATGPTGLAEGVPDRPVVDQQTTHRALPQQTDDTQDATDVRGDTGKSYRAQWVHDLVGFTGLLLVLWFLGSLLRIVVELVGPRLSAKQLVVDLDPLPDVQAGREAAHPRPRPAARGPGLHRHPQRHRGVLGAAGAGGRPRQASYDDPRRPPPSSSSASCTPSTSTRGRWPSWPGSTTRRGSPPTRSARTPATGRRAALGAIHDELAHLEATT